jgi:hypothetical protein
VVAGGRGAGGVPRRFGPSYADVDDRAANIVHEVREFFESPLRRLGGLLKRAGHGCQFSRRRRIMPD